VSAGAARPTAAPDPLDVTFHHIHVNDPAPQRLVDYYGKLFRADTTHATTVGAVRGVEADGVFLLIDQAPRMPPESGSAGWHFGWGTVSVDEAYDRHRMQEIEWELPLESFSRDLHLHLESEDPAKAAEWYRDRFGAVLEVAPASPGAVPLNPAHRRPAAIVRLDRIALAIYKSAGPLAPSRGHRIDHIAFRADLGRVRERTDLKVLTPAARLGTFETMVIEGPDQLAIELVGAPSFPPVIQSSAGC
jgi:hypothetical protein